MKQIVFISLMASLISAAPIIKVDKVDFDFGTVPSGNGELKHTFIISNTGDQTLKIEKVKPGCSCSVGEFDSELKPGESSKLTAALSMKDRTGKQDKPITVISNAENAPLLKLTLQAFILGPMNMDRKYGIFEYTGKPIKDSITILSTRKGVKVTSAWYEKRSTEGASKKVPVTAVLVPTGKQQAQNSTEYRLVFNFKVKPTETEAGTLYFKTNHPESPLLEFRCMIEKK